MNICAEEYKELKRKTEKKLREYPYYLISLENPGLKGSTRYDEVSTKTNSFNSTVENSVIDADYMKSMVNVINCVLDRLDSCSKRIIETAYFRDDILKEDVQAELMIDKNRYYRLKKKSLEKFMIVFR
ncbi:nitroreductase [Clostridium sp. SHJSY1]|uniref:nitroreductase n=1 Tax=Clostridium sp. SHJSY1 TaxID=2942483 RepID=UPI002874799C|nr:nitroreductase [Clostridium sp. SHJSY1]MDS0525009.1 nitroreductase [Clostridium sp. SHJSY1]